MEEEQFLLCAYKAVVSLLRFFNSMLVLCQGLNTTAWSSTVLKQLTATMMRSVVGVVAAEHCLKSD